MTETQYLKARGCGYTVPEGDEDLLSLHEEYCPLCKDTEGIRRRLRLERARKKQEK